MDHLSENLAQDESVNIRHYLHIVLERRWLVLAAFLIVVILTALYLFKAKPIYGASSRLQIDRESENALRMDSFVMDSSQEQDYLQTQFKNLTSRSIMEAVLNKTIENGKILKSISEGKKSLNDLISATGLGKVDVVKRLNDLSDAGFFGSNIYTDGDVAPILPQAKEDNNLIPGIIVFNENSEENNISSEELRSNQLNQLSGAIYILPVRLSRLVDIVAESPNRNEAALIANTLVAEFLKHDEDRKRDKLSNAVKFLKEEVDNLNEAVHSNYMNLHNFKTEWDIISLVETQNTTLSALMQAQSDYDSAHSNAVKSKVTATEATRVFKETSEYSGIPEVAADAECKTLRGNVALAESELASLSERYLEKHPKIIEKKSSIAVLKRSLKAAEKSIYNSILNTSQLAEETDIQMEGVLTIRKAEQQSMNQKSIEYNNLNRTAIQSEAMYDLALQRLKETELQAKDIVKNMHIIDLAIPKKGAVKPKRFLVSLIGIVGGLSIGMGLAFFINFF